ncbi:MAG: hypothetical protein Fur0025_13940 [Oscillatoriaceae cyanobacterium]
MIEKPGFYSGGGFVIGGYVLIEKPGFYSSNGDGDEGAGNGGENGGGAYGAKVDTPVLVGVVAHFFSALLIDAWG